MKILFVIVLLGLSQYAFAKDDLQEFSSRAFEETIINVVECVRAELNQGIPEYEIPHFNPLILTKEYIDLDLLEFENLSGYIEIEDLELKGITHFEINNLKGSIGLIPPSYSLSASINFPKLIFKSKYSTNVNFEDTALFGTGILEFDNNNLSIDLDLKAKISSSISLTDFNLWIKSDSLTSFKITGLLNDEEYSSYLSEFIFNNYPSIIDDLSPVISDFIKEIVINFNEDIKENDLISYFTDKCLS